MLIYPTFLETRVKTDILSGAKKDNISSYTIWFFKEFTQIAIDKYSIDGLIIDFSNRDIIINLPNYPLPIYLYTLDKILILSSRQKYFQYFDYLTLTPISKNDFLLQNWNKKQNSFFKEVKKIPYKSSLKIDINTFKITCKTENHAIPIWQGNFDDAKTQLFALLRKYIMSEYPKVAVPISGGIDSASVAALLNTHSHIFTYTIGTEEGNEYKGASENANYIGTKHKEVFIDNDEYMHILENCITLQEFMDIRYAEGFVGFYKVYENAVHDGINQIFTGYGADLILGDIFSLEDKTTCNEIAQKALIRTNYTGEMDDGIATNFQCQIHHPFLATEIINFALSLPYSYKLHENQVKYILRKLLSEQQLLPESVIKHPKVAFSQGTAFDKILAKMLKINPTDYTSKQLFLYDKLYSLLYSNHN
jgi:asparagine synthetase B (glutamine-hydrolysing)